MDFNLAATALTRFTCRSSSRGQHKALVQADIGWRSLCLVGAMHSDALVADRRTAECTAANKNSCVDRCVSLKVVTLTDCDHTAVVPAVGTTIRCIRVIYNVYL